MPATTFRRSASTTAAALSVIAATAGPASAHFDPLVHGSVLAGLTHPLSGIDHILAMVTVGVWAALIGGRAVWIVPVAFVATMLAGFSLALAGVALPWIEPAILASIIVLGLLAAIALPVPVMIAAAVVALFAVFHGFAHGGEMGTAAMSPYAAGFAAATVALHMAGILGAFALVQVFGPAGGRTVARAAGAAAALVGMAMALS